MASNEELVAAVLLIRAPTKIDAVTLDCSVSETHTGETEVTDHPVEEGFNIADHARPKPPMLTMEGIVSNTPITPAAQVKLREVKTYLGTLDSTASIDAVRGQPGLAEVAYAALNKLRESGAMMTVQTSLRTYTNMVMTSLVIPRNSTIGDAFRFTAVFKYVRVVASKVSAATTLSGASGKKTSTGKQTGKKTDASSDNKSWLYELSEKSGLLEKVGIKLPGSVAKKP